MEKKEYGLPIITLVNLRKLHEKILPKFGKLSELQSILKKTPDLNAEIKRLVDTKSLHKYQVFNYDCKITVANAKKNGIGITLKEFMEHYYGDALNSYYKITENSVVFIHRYKIGEILEVTIDFGIQSVDVTGRIISEEFTKYLNGEKTNNIKRESDENE